MSNVLKTRIIKIGNSQGVRIPKVFLDQTNLSAEVELEVQGEQIVIRPLHHARNGWEEQFRAMAEQGDDQLLDPIITTTWDDNEWEW